MTAPRDPSMVNTIEGLSEAVAGRKPLQLGPKWRVFSRPYPNPDSSYCLVFESYQSGSWVPVYAIGPDGNTAGGT